MKIEETASAILGDNLFQICFLIEIAYEWIFLKLLFLSIVLFW